MSELRISELVKSSRSLYGEVSPHVLVRSEGQFLYSSTVRFESLVGVLSSYPTRQTVTVGLWRVLGIAEVYWVHTKWGLFVHHPDISDSVERDTHSDLELDSGQLDAADHLSAGVLHLHHKLKI